QLNSPGSTVGGLAQSTARQVINRKVFRDNPRIAQTLQDLNLSASVREVIRQMKRAGATVLAQTITAIPTTVGLYNANFNGAGNGVIVASVNRSSDGLVCENSFAETVLFTCTSDSYVGGATLGNEGFTVTGTGQQNNVFAFDWPLGSNGQQNQNAIDGSVSNGSGNLLVNSGFDNWTSNVPDNYTIVSGGGLIAEETTIVYDGVASLRLTGDGATQAEWYQEFDSNTGTTTQLTPLTQYGFNIFLRRDGIAAANGTLEISLCDDSGTVVSDDNGYLNLLSVDLTALTTSFLPFKFPLRTPLVMPSTYRLRFRTTGTALTNGRSVYLDRGGMGGMTQLYVGGPSFAIFSGSLPFENGDWGTWPVTNSRGAGGTLSTFQTLCDQLLGLRTLDFLLPSSATPTISDTLIG